MRSILLSLICFYAWIGDLIIPERRRTKAKMEELRRRDPFNYPTY